MVMGNDGGSQPPGPDGGDIESGGPNPGEAITPEEPGLFRSTRHPQGGTREMLGRLVNGLSMSAARHRTESPALAIQGRIDSTKSSPARPVWCLLTALKG